MDTQSNNTTYKAPTAEKIRAGLKKDLHHKGLCEIANDIAWLVLDDPEKVRELVRFSNYGKYEVIDRIFNLVDDPIILDDLLYFSDDERTKIAYIHHLYKEYREYFEQFLPFQHSMAEYTHMDLKNRPVMYASVWQAGVYLIEAVNAKKQQLRESTK